MNTRTLSPTRLVLALLTAGLLGGAGATYMAGGPARADAALYAAKDQGRDGFVGATQAHGLRPAAAQGDLAALLGDPRSRWTTEAFLPGGLLQSGSDTALIPASPVAQMTAFQARLRQQHPWMDLGLARRWAGGRVSRSMPSNCRRWAVTWPIPIPGRTGRRNPNSAPHAWRPGENKT